MKKIALLLFGRYIKKVAWKTAKGTLPYAERKYAWVINSPVSQWRIRLWCLRRCDIVGAELDTLYEWLTRQDRGCSSRFHTEA